MNREIKKIITVGSCWLLVFFLPFLFLAFNIKFGGGAVVANFDRTIIHFFGQSRNPFLSSVMLWSTELGSEKFIILLLIITSIFLGLRKKYGTIAVFLVSFAGGEILLSLTKRLVERARPEILTHLELADGFSFPSGHTFAAVSFYGLAGYFLFRYAKKTWTKILVVIVVIGIIKLVAYSRIYLGVHYPSDTLGSFLLGVSWIIIIITAMEAWKINNNTSKL